MSTLFPFFNRRPSQGKSILPQGGNADIIQEAQREILRQARRSYNLHEIGIAASIVIGTVAGGLALSDHLTEAGITAATGGGFIAYSAQLHKETQEKLEELLKSLKEVSKG